MFSSSPFLRDRRRKAADEQFVIVGLFLRLLRRVFLNVHGFPVDALLRKLKDRLHLLLGAERDERVAFAQVDFQDAGKIGEVQPKGILGSFRYTGTKDDNGKLF